MIDAPQQTFSRRTLATIVLLAGGGMLALLQKGAFFTSLLAAGAQFAAVAAMLASAGGLGKLLTGWAMPADAPRPLRLASMTIAGLWALATAVWLTCRMPGLASPYIWWPVLAVGFVPAAVAAWRHMPAGRPGRTDARALVWVVLAVAAAYGLALVVRPPGFVGLPYTRDALDVLSFHLQAPREWFDGGMIAPLPHNALADGAGMMHALYFLAMVLTGSAYHAMDFCQMLHLGLAAMAVLAIILSLRDNDGTRGRLAGALLGTAPAVLYLGAMARAEMAAMLALTLGLLWLRHSLNAHDFKSACWSGAAVGVAVSANWSCLVLAAAPVLAAMSLLSVAQPRRLAQVAAAIALAAAAAAPWLLTTQPRSVLDALETQQAAYRVEPMPAPASNPATAPATATAPTVQPGYIEPLPPSQSLYEEFIANQAYGPIVMVLAAAAMLAVVLSPRRSGPFDAALTCVLILQLFLWAAWLRLGDWMLTPVLPTMALLAGGVLTRLSAVETNPLRRDAAGSRNWGLAPAVAIALAAIGVNLVITHSLGGRATGGWREERAIKCADVAADHAARNCMPLYEPAYKLGPQARIALAGEAAPFYMPRNTIYWAPASQAPWLTGDTCRELIAAGATHLWVERAGQVLPPETMASIESLLDQQPPLECLTLERRIEIGAPATAPATAPAPAGAAKPRIAIFRVQRP
jgi:hypothetical protein